jgi:hypothetical protein
MHAKFTEEQEAEFTRTEAVMTRARIIERGVASVLNSGEYANANEVGVCATMIAESVALRVEAEGIRESIRKAEREANPRPPKVKVRPVIEPEAADESEEVPERI